MKGRSDRGADGTRALTKEACLPEQIADYHVNKDGPNSIGGFDAHGLIEKEKWSSIAGLLVGILLAIIGTMMLRSTTPQIVYAYEHDDEEEPLEERRFRL